MIAFELGALTALDATIRLLPGAGAGSSVTQVVTDSRAACAGALFIALSVEHFDGHSFLPQVVAKGAAQLGISSAYLQAHAPQIKAWQGQGISVLVSDDTQRLLGLCALCVRQQCPAKIAALSGSCGKTTVKEMTASILAHCGKVLYTAGNFNNDVGVPLTLLRLSTDLDFAVIEQGASHRGDLKRTCEFVKADAALITNVGQAHIEGFGSAEGVYLGKRELIEDVAARGKLAVVPAAGPFAERFAADFAALRKIGHLLTFGPLPDDRNSPLPDAAYSMVQGSAQGISFRLQLKDLAAPLTLNLPLLGVHNAANAAAAALLAVSLGADSTAVQTGLQECAMLPGRLQRLELPGITLLNDAYNASFNAVLSALQTLQLFAPAKRIMVFGDMGELGTAAVQLHTRVGQAANGCCDSLYCLGPLSAQAAAAFTGPAQHFNTHDKLCAALCQELTAAAQQGQHCCVLIKGSHSMHMERVTTFLQERAASAQALG